MTKLATPKTLTVRLAPEVYRAATDLAHKRAVSLNSLIQNSLLNALRTEEEKARYDAYTELGQDREACSVEYAIYAQAEVMLQDEF